MLGGKWQWFKGNPSINLGSRDIILGQGAGKELEELLNLYSAVAVLLELNRGSASTIGERCLSCCKWLSLGEGPNSI